MKSKRALYFSYASLIILVIAILKMSKEAPQLQDSKKTSENLSNIIQQPQRLLASKEAEAELHLAQYLNSFDVNSDWQTESSQGALKTITGGKISLSHFHNSSFQFAQEFIKRLNQSTLNIAEEEQNIQDTPFTQISSFPQTYLGYEIDGGYFKMSISKKDQSIYVINNELQEIKKVIDEKRLSLDEVILKLKTEKPEQNFKSVSPNPVFKYIPSKKSHVLCYKILNESKSGRPKRAYNFYSTADAELLYSQNLIMR